MKHSEIRNELRENWGSVTRSFRRDSDRIETCITPEFAKRIGIPVRCVSISKTPEQTRQNLESLIFDTLAKTRATDDQFCDALARG